MTIYVAGFVRDSRNWLWRARADVYALRGKWDQAIADYVRAVQREMSRWIIPFWCACWIVRQTARLSGERFDAATFDTLLDWIQFWGLSDGAILGGTGRLRSAGCSGRIWVLW